MAGQPGWCLRQGPESRPPAPLYDAQSAALRGCEAEGLFHPASGNGGVLQPIKQARLP